MKIISFGISGLGAGRFLVDFNLSPEVAAKRNPEAFLKFAEEVAKVARKLAAERCQTTLNLETTPW